LLQNLTQLIADANGNAPQLHNGVARPMIAAPMRLTNKDDDDNDDETIIDCIDDGAIDVKNAEIITPNVTQGTVSRTCPTNLFQNFDTKDEK
jgi:hypothetical protein